MKNRLLAGIAVSVLLFSTGVSFLLAVVPKQWDIRSMEDWLKGKSTGISISSDGYLSLAPKDEKIEAPAEEFYMSFLVDQEGVIYLGTGHGGKVYRIGRDGKAELFFQAAEMDVTCLAKDGKGNLFAATSPNGKIYRISAKDKGEEFFNPAERYIWDMAFTDSGLMWAAVGESGGIYAITPQGEGRMIFKAEDNHILCLTKSATGEFIAGSGGKGLVYKISAEGKASVVFETPYEEVRSIAIDDEGMIYAAVSGAAAVSKAEAAGAAPAEAPVRIETGVSITVSASAPAPAGERARPAEEKPAVKAGGAVYLISRSGVGQILWESPEEMVYSLLLDREKDRIIFGTGGNGRLYSVDKNHKSSLLLQFDSEQVYRIISLTGRIRIIANNPCYLGDVLPEQRFTGEYLSQVLDSGIVSDWGRIMRQAEVPAGTVLQFQTRSGNTAQPNSTWSDWSPFYQKEEEQILSPRGRFLQFKALFKTQSGQVSPLLNRLLAFYLQANAAPFFTRLEILKPNEIYLKLPVQEDVILGAEKNLRDPQKETDELNITYLRKKSERKGLRTVTWEASDRNGDDLEYGVSIRRDGEKEWRRLQDGIRETVFAFDTFNFPDGTYFLRLEASDVPTNPAGIALKSEKETRAFVIDNSQPVFKNFSAVKSGAALQIEFQAEDSYSAIEEVRYLVRPGEWRVVFPVDGICDSKNERFKFTVTLPPAADNLISVRARDGHGNVGVHRQVF